MHLRSHRAFGKLVADAQDDELRRNGAIRAARTLVLGGVAPGAGRSVPVSRRAWWRVAGALAGTIAVAACALLVVHLRAKPPAFEVGRSESASGQATLSRPGVAGEWIAAPAHEWLPLRFSDGSLVRLGPAAHARVAEVTADGGRVLLESGLAHVHVVHHDRTHWIVQAGPFEVRVTGTQFDIAWDPAGGVFSLTMQEGRVLVSGCSMSEARGISDGATFSAACKEGQLAPVVVPSSSPGHPFDAAPVDALPATSWTAAPAVAAAPAQPLPGWALRPLPGSAPQPSPERATRRSPERLPTSLPARPSPPESRPSWREQLTLGSYAGAVDAADAEGLASVCATATADDLMRLSDGERFTGHTDHAELVLLEVRRRFPADGQASIAAFNLGRIAFDDRASYAEAGRWFAKYLDERPSGALAREALGRQMEALDRSGDHGAAARVADRYLAAFPTGPHAAMARSLVPR